MRDIKFRAWNKYEQKMITHGNLFRLDTSNEEPFLPLLEEFTHQYEIMQYTGLHGYDKKEICAGDIIYYNGRTGYPILQAYGIPGKNPKGEIFIVADLECGFVLRHISTYGNGSFNIPNCIINGWPLMHNYDLWNHQGSCEVIGNIYENPELLEESK